MEKKLAWDNDLSKLTESEFNLLMDAALSRVVSPNYSSSPMATIYRGSIAGKFAERGLFTEALDLGRRSDPIVKDHVWINVINVMVKKKMFDQAIGLAKDITTVPMYAAPWQRDSFEKIILGLKDAGYNKAQVEKAFIRHNVKLETQKIILEDYFPPQIPLNLSR